MLEIKAASYLHLGRGQGGARVGLGELGGYLGT